MTSPVADRSVLITGGSGAFGSAFARRCLEDGARRVVILSRSESKQAAMQAEIPDPRLRFLVGDVRDAVRMVDACRGVEVVVHAAALKRVEVCEADPLEANKTNIDGSVNVARACIANGVGLAVLLSTDKASEPNTHYGKTKAVAESSWNGMNVYSAGAGTRFAATRYGNVLGSTGSVIPTWKVEAQHGRAITLTEPTMSRFWMPMSAAVDLVLYALREMRGGEVFVPRIGASTVAELAMAVAPGAEWKLVGPRAGEKFHESLISPEESRHTHDAGSVFIIEPEARIWGDVDPLPYPSVVPGFSYTSDTAPRLSAEQLRQLVAA